jgi:hypothetical protein
LYVYCTFTFILSFSHKEPYDSPLGPKHTAYVKIQNSSFGDGSMLDPQSVLAYCTADFIM